MAGTCGVPNITLPQRSTKTLQYIVIQPNHMSSLLPLNSYLVGSTTAALELRQTKQAVVINTSSAPVIHHVLSSEYGWSYRTQRFISIVACDAHEPRKARFVELLRKKIQNSSSTRSLCIATVYRRVASAYATRCNWRRYKALQNSTTELQGTWYKHNSGTNAIRL